jgi:hypothetical protein
MLVAIAKTEEYIGRNLKNIDAVELVYIKDNGHHD